jgi:vacuolar-type H+-ATPase subunit I/STV1
MRFLLTEDFWVLDALSPAEWHLVAELPAAASGESFSESARERLFPPPVDPKTEADPETLEQAADWKDYVQPELEELFDDARKTVEKDIESVETISAEDFLGPDQPAELASHLPELRRVRIPIENSEAWYSTLNQARLLMNEEHALAESEERLLARLEQADEIDEDRFLLIAQYELYSAVQIMLVENVMEGGS